MGPKPNTDIKIVVKEVIKELLADEEFMDKILKKINDKIEKLITNTSKFEEQIKVLENKMENMQQYQKLNNLCIYGIEEHDNEKLDEKVINMFKEKMNIDVDKKELIKCYRIGNVRNKRRPIIIRFETLYVRNHIYRNTKMLKGKKIGIAEDLIKTKMELFKHVQERVGDRKKVRTFDGNIFLYLENKKYKINDIADLENIFK